MMRQLGVSLTVLVLMTVATVANAAVTGTTNGDFETGTGVLHDVPDWYESDISDGNWDDFVFFGGDRMPGFSSTNVLFFNPPPSTPFVYQQIGTFTANEDVTVTGDIYRTIYHDHILDFSVDLYSGNVTPVEGTDLAALGATLLDSQMFTSTGLGMDNFGTTGVAAAAPLSAPLNSGTAGSDGDPLWLQLTMIDTDSPTAQTGFDHIAVNGLGGDPPDPVSGISVNFVEDADGTSPYTGPGVLDTSERTWNTMTGVGSNDNGSLGPAVATFGDVTVEVEHYADFGHSAHTYPTVDLFDGYIWGGGNGGDPAGLPASSITLSGLDDSLTYDLALFAAWDWAGDQQASDFTVGGTTKTTLGTPDPGNPEDPRPNSFIEGENYVTFLGLQPSDGEIVIDLGTVSDPTWLVNGIELTVIPEPGTIAMLLGGLATLALALWRRR